MFVTKRHLFTATLSLLIVVASTFATPVYITDIPTQTVSGYRSSPPYGWTYKFDMGFSDLELNVQLRILLTGFNPGSAFEETWESGIENMWARKFDIVDGDFHYHVNFDTAFSHSSADSTHHNVTVINGQGGGDMLHWYTTSAWGSPYNGAYVAHEVGHMFSLYDEYSGGAVNPSDPLIDYSSIMGSLAGIPYERHYQPFLDWLQPAASGRQLYLDGYDPYWVNPEIPEPATWLLLAIGALLQRKMKNRKSFR
jgi:hypothetical protein